MNEVDPGAEDVVGKILLDPAIGDGIGDQSEDAGVGLVPQIQPAASALELAMELVPRLLTLGVGAGVGEGGVLGMQAQEEALLDEGGVGHASWTRAVGRFGGQGYLGLAIVLEEIGEVAAVKHQMEGAVNLGLVNGLEDAVEILDGAGGVGEVSGGGQGLGGRGIVGVEVDGRQGAVGAPMGADRLPGLDGAGIADGHGVGDDLLGEPIWEGAARDGGGGGDGLGHEPGQFGQVVGGEGEPAPGLGRGLGAGELGAVERGRGGSAGGGGRGRRGQGGGGMGRGLLTAFGAGPQLVAVPTGDGVLQVLGDVVVGRGGGGRVVEPATLGDREVG